MANVSGFEYIFRKFPGSGGITGGMAVYTWKMHYGKRQIDIFADINAEDVIEYSDMETESERKEK